MQLLDHWLSLFTTGSLLLIFPNFTSTKISLQSLRLCQVSTSVHKCFGYFGYFGLCLFISKHFVQHQ